MHNLLKIFILLKKEYPPYVPTPEEIKSDQEDWKMQKTFFVGYIAFFAILMLIIWIVGLARADEQKDSPERILSEICAHKPNSPLCIHPFVLEKVQKIADKKNVPIRLILWIWNAESSLWTNFSNWTCAKYHNWAGLKGKKFDDGSVEYYQANRKKPDENGCWLYRFWSFEEGTEALVNTIALGYEACDHKVTCIAYAFVGNPDVAEESWIRNVEKFYDSPER